MGRKRNPGRIAQHLAPDYLAFFRVPGVDAMEILQMRNVQRQLVNSFHEVVSKGGRRRRHPEAGGVASPSGEQIVDRQPAAPASSIVGRNVGMKMHEMAGGS